jgi:hypothetical protein
VLEHNRDISLLQAVCALAHGKPIVTPQYWDHYITSLSTLQPVPDCMDYIPALAETTLNMNKVSFGINENRKKLFAGKHFVFASLQQYNAYSCMVTAAGKGIVILLLYMWSNLLITQLVIIHPCHNKSPALYLSLVLWDICTKHKL